MSEQGQIGSMGDHLVTLHLRHVVPADPARGYVPATEFAILADGAPVGEITLRMEETEHLRRYGGQVAYSVLPEHRGHGFAARALRLLLPIAHEAGFERLWITCDPDNSASRRTIEKAGGRFVETRDLPPGSEQYERGGRRISRFRIMTAD